jgi:hypothetical protein
MVLEFIKELTRPNYWRPDNECHTCFICKHPFNNTTHRLHHWYVIQSVFHSKFIVFFDVLVENVVKVFAMYVHQTNVLYLNEIGYPLNVFVHHASKQSMNQTLNMNNSNYHT